jgi:secreted Zn-dependent insulinase-like peptidase
MGNKETLAKPNIRAALLDFHKNQYSSNRAYSVFLTNRPIEECIKLTVDAYSDIPNKHLAPISYANEPNPYAGINQLQK